MRVVRVARCGMSSGRYFVFEKYIYLILKIKVDQFTSESLGPRHRPKFTIFVKKWEIDPRLTFECYFEFV